MCEYCEKPVGLSFYKSLIDEEYSHTNTKEPVRADVYIEYVSGRPCLNVNLISHEADEWMGDVSCDINYCPMCGRNLREVDNGTEN